MGKKIKKVVITTGLLTLVAFSGLVGKTDNAPSFGGITAYASEQTVNQSTRWEGNGDSWKVKGLSGGYLVNSWFQDNDSSWYMLGADEIMFSGLITDQSTGKTYMLNINHDGTYGRMLTTDGVYEINGKSVYLSFDQEHNGSYGAITSGLNEARSTGVSETGLASIPTDSASESGSKQPETEKPAEKVKDAEYYAGDPYREWEENHPDERAGSGMSQGTEWN